MNLGEANKGLWLWLHGHPGAWSAEEVARRTGYAPSNVFRALHAMVRRNLIEQTDPPAGERKKRYAVTGNCLVPLGLTVAEAQVDSHAMTAGERGELERLRALINTPHTANWMHAVELEAAHQQERWGADHDAGKAPEDWFWLLGYLGGKAVAALKSQDQDKGLHHIVSSGAALLNWHRATTGTHTAMRPGIDPVMRGLEVRPHG